jgi:transcriptional regulator with XRE-family HTH domain
MSRHTGENLTRLMAAQGLSIDDVVERTGLDRRTIQAILSGHQRAHALTLNRLARGLGVAVDELFLDPSRLVYRHFDRLTNPVVEELLESHPDLFADWGEADFAELSSRVGKGGPLTAEGALAAARRINWKRALFQKLALLLETSLAEVIGGIIDTMYEKIVLKGGRAGP